MFDLTSEIFTCSEFRLTLFSGTGRYLETSGMLPLRIRPSGIHFDLIYRAILRDERLFENPSDFYPERYMEKVDPATEKKRDPRNYVFGFGRRHVLFVLFCYYSHSYVKPNTSPLFIHTDDVQVQISSSPPSGSW